MTKYEAGKNRVCEQAHDYVDSFADGVRYSWGEIAEIQSYFEKMGKRYGLLTEFRENGIC